MKNKVLYFPYINVPNSAWFTRMLLYWDEVGVIVPYDFIQKPEKLDEYTRSMVLEGMIKQVIPTDHIYKIPHYRKAFLSHLNALDGRVLIKRQEAFAAGHRSMIHIDKMDELGFDMKYMKLAEQGRFPWWFVEGDTAGEFMAYLAATLGKLDELQYDPVSDDIRHLERFMEVGGDHRSSRSPISNLRIQILQDVFPSPRFPLRADQVSRFKERHGNRLKAFRLRVEKEIVDISNVQDENLRMQRLELFREQTQDAIAEIVEVLREGGFKDNTVSKLASIVSSIPGVSFVVGLANAVHDAFKTEDLLAIDPSFLYAAYAQKEILD